MRFSKSYAIIMLILYLSLTLYSLITINRNRGNEINLTTVKISI